MSADNIVNVKIDVLKKKKKSKSKKVDHQWEKSAET
jgi:hypothetical protein